MATDDENLGILVRLAANGELSADDVAQVERLIADRPELVAEYERARRDAQRSRPGDIDLGGGRIDLGDGPIDTAHIANGDDSGSDLSASLAPPPPARAPTRGPSGCLVGIGAFILTIVVMATIGIVARARSGSPAVSSSPIQAVLDDPDNEVLPLAGPAELVRLGALALMYSPATGDAVLLGQQIASDGELFGSDAPESPLASFRAGDVEVLVVDLNPDQTLTVVASADP